MWLKIFFILYFLGEYSAFDLPRKCLSDIKINNDHYNVSQVYPMGVNRPNVVSYPTDAHFDVFGNLFYVESLHIDEAYLYNINVIKFNATVPEYVPGLPMGVGYSIAIDKKQTKVFFGTMKGLYEYNYETQTAVSISSNTFKLEDMIFVDKNSNKYVVETVNGIHEFYLLDGEKKIRCNSLEALNEAAVDDKNNFYFIREEKLFVLKSTQTNATCIGNVTYNGIAQIAFYGNNIYVASDNLAYLHENDTGNLKVIDIHEKVTAIAFDDTGSFILGVKGKILKYKKNDCYLRKSRVIDDYEGYNKL